MVAFGIPFIDEPLPLDRSAVVAFLQSEVLEKTLMGRADRDLIANPTAVANPTGLLNRAFFFLTHREVSLLIVRNGLVKGPLSKQSVTALANAYGEPVKSLQKLETDALQGLALALRLCGSEDTWPGGKSLKVLRLSVPTEHLLFREGIVSVEQLRVLPDEDLALLRQFGPGRVREVREALTRYFAVSLVDGA